MSKGKGKGTTGPVRTANIPRVFKNALSSPFNLQWRHVRSTDREFIFQQLQQSLAGFAYEKKPTSSKRRKCGKDGPSAVSTPKSPTDIAGTLSPGQNVEADAEACAGERVKSGRRLLAIGVNACTRALEQSDLRFLLVCRSCRVPVLTRHLLPLAYIKGCPAAALPTLSDSVGKVLGVRRILALGVKKVPESSEDFFADLVASVTARLPELDIPWLIPTSPPVEEPSSVVHAPADQEQSLLSETINEPMCSTDSGLVNKAGASSVNQLVTPVSNRKRKHDDSSISGATKRRRGSLENVQSSRIDYLQLKIHTTCSNLAKQQKKYCRKRKRRKAKLTPSKT